MAAPDFRTFRWITGVYLLVLGMSLLILPQGKLAVYIYPVWAYAFGTFCTGLALLWLTVLKLPKTWNIAISSLIAVPLLASTWAYIEAGIIPSATILGLMAVGIIVLSLLAPLTDNHYHPDALGLIFGIVQVTQGLDLVIRSGANTAVAATSVIPTNVLVFILIASGLAVVVTQLTASTPVWIRKLSHAVAGFAVLFLWVFQSISVDPVYWILGAASVIRGLTLVLLPWGSQWIKRIDNTALRPRLTLALITAATLPALISILIFLPLLETALIDDTQTRPAVFGVMLVFAAASGMAAWWFAGRLTIPLTVLITAVQQVSEGKYGLELRHNGTTEMHNLGIAIEHMAQTIQTRAAERNQMIEQLEGQNRTLQSLEKSFRMVAENATDIIARFDRNLSHLYVNPAAEKATGIPVEQFFGKTNRVLGLPDPPVTQWDINLNLVFATGQPTTLNFTFVSGENERYYQSLLAPEFDDAGRVISVLSIVRDITELKTTQRQTEQALQAMLVIASAFATRSPAALSETMRWQASAERLLHAICDALTCEGAVMLVVTPDTHLIVDLIATGFEEVKGMLLERVHGQTLHDRFIDPTIVPRLESGEIIQLDVSQPAYRDRQPRTGLEKTLLVPMRVEGVLVGIITMYPRTEAQVNANEWLAIASAAGSLAALLLERERLFTEREEAQTLALAAQEVTRQMDTFISIVSHELNTPLTAMRGNVQLVQRRLKRLLQQTTVTEDKTNDVFVLLDRIDKHIGVQNNLVNDLLDSSRIQAEKLVLHVEECDLTQIVREAVEDQRNVAPTRVISLTMPEHAIMVQADAQRIAQVVNNYLSNALKYSQSDCPVDVTVALIASMDRPMDRPAVQVAVRDKGPGLSPVEQGRIWERFYRSPGIEVKTGSGVGLGLGLHICKQLIERQGGQVGVDSTPGVGSTFWFTLPLAL